MEENEKAIVHKLSVGADNEQPLKIQTTKDIIVDKIQNVNWKFMANRKVVLLW